MAQLVKNPLQCGRPGLDPWVGKILWRRERLPTPVLWPGEFLDSVVHGVAKSRTRLSDFHFSWQNNFLLYMCTTSLSILLDGHLACHVLAIVNSAAMNIGVHIFFQIIVLSR